MNIMQSLTPTDIKSNREMAEYIAVYGDPKFARKAFQHAALQRFAQPALPPTIIIDSKSGEPLPQSQIESHIYIELQKEFKLKNVSRPITEGDMMLACQAYYARHNPTAFVAFRDTAGAKPIDETKELPQDDPYENMSDDELLALKMFREARQKELIEAKNE